MRFTWLAVLLWLFPVRAAAQDRFVRVAPVPEDATVVFFHPTLPRGQLQGREVRLGPRAGTVEVLVRREGYREERATLTLLEGKAVSPQVWEFRIELYPATLGTSIGRVFRRQPALAYGVPTVLLLMAGCGYWRARRRRVLVQSEKEELEARLEEVDPDLTGRRIGEYRVLEKLGEGAFAQVYRVRHERFRDEAALKILKPEVLDSDNLDRFDREARIVQQLKHPALVRLEALGTYLDRPYLVMELMPDGALGGLLERGSLPVSRALELLREIAEGVAHAHVRGIVHRDLKPGNILLSGGRAKVVDFGVARLTGSSRLTRTGDALGTPGYMAPEQLCGQADHRADVYALGVVLFEMLTGRVPFRGDSLHEIITGHLCSPVPNASDLNPSVPGALDRLLQRMLAKDPEERFQSLEELLEALKQVSPRQTV